MAKPIILVTSMAEKWWKGGFPLMDSAIFAMVLLLLLIMAIKDDWDEKNPRE